MLTYPDGKLMLQKSIEGLMITVPHRIIITIVKEHCQKYDADIILKQAFGDKVEICVLNDYTASQSETVFLSIQKMNVQGGFIAKDCDGYVKLTIDDFDNFLVGVDLRKNREITNVAQKSFLILNEQNMIIDIIEKSVCSNIINIGVYGFRSSEEFTQYYEIVNRAWSSEKGEIYLSHVISYMIGKMNYFSYREVTEYEEWGVISDWAKALKQRRTFFIDIDGIIFKNKGQHGRLNWDTEDEPIESNIKTIKRLVNEGAQIIFCTARSERFRKKLEASLSRLGINYHAIIMGCNHSQRVIINDFANTNPYPSCIAVNVPRDNEDLEKYIYKDY